MNSSKNRPTSKKLQVVDPCIECQKSNFSGTPPSSIISFDTKSIKNDLFIKPVYEHDQMKLSRNLSIGINIPLDQTKLQCPGSFSYFYLNDFFLRVGCFENC